MELCIQRVLGDDQAGSALSADLPSDRQFQQWVGAALDGRSAELTIRIVAETEARRLNRQYRNKDYATNVLSFPAELPAEIGSRFIGDIVICAPVVAAEAGRQRKPPLEHWAHLTVHGVLHLLGYDHLDDTQAEVMEDLERRLLAGFGIDDPYR